MRLSAILGWTIAALLAGGVLAPDSVTAALCIGSVLRLAASPAVRLVRALARVRLRLHAKARLRAASMVRALLDEHQDRYGTPRRG